MKRKESTFVVGCLPERGPVFLDGNKKGSDILIGDKCNTKNSCWTSNNGNKGYKCHPKYKSSLFVNTNEPDKENMFSVLDYEVYCIDYENIDYVYANCNYPDIVMEYIDTKDISEMSLTKSVDEDRLRSDLNSIHCAEIAIRLKISKCCLKNPSQFLPNTQIVDQQYDSYLRKWIGNKQTELLYRASEYNYTFESFHECCDDYDHLLVIIKSTEGWIFGGYTSMSWKVNNSNGKGCILLYFPLIV